MVKLTRQACYLGAGLLFAVFTQRASAHELTAEECVEGGEFIKHAAMARDNGLSRATFLQRMQDDLEAIKAFPPHLRWFVQDEADQALLVGAAERVFDAPRAPEEHQFEFVAVCPASERLSSGEEAHIDAEQAPDSN